MKKLSIALLLWLGTASAVLAQQVVNPIPNAGNYGAYNTAPPTCVAGSGCWLQTDINGQLKVTGSFSVGGYDIAVTNTPTVQNASYSSGNAIGGLQTIAFFRTTAQPSGILNNISVASQGGSTTALTLYIFNSNPSASTCTDKSAFALNSADVSKLIATTPPVLTPAVVGTGATVTFASQQLPISVTNVASALNLYICAVVGGTVTPASTTDLVFKFAGVQD